MNWRGKKSETRGNGGDRIRSEEKRLEERQRKKREEKRLSERGMCGCGKGHSDSEERGMENE